MGNTALTAATANPTNGRGPGDFCTPFIDINLVNPDGTTVLTTAEVYQALAVPAGAQIIGVGVRILEVVAGSSVLTVDIGMGGGATFMDNLDLKAATLGQIFNSTVAWPTAANTDITAEAADTIDMTVTMTGACTAGKVRLFAHLALPA
jgi:hypothetical protein